MAESAEDQVGRRPNGSYDAMAYKTALETAARNPAQVVRDDGDVAAAMKRARLL